MEDAAVALRALEEELRLHATGFDFFQAVRLLERLRPDREGVGRFVDPADEAVRFAVTRGISFPASEIERLDLPAEGPARMTVNFMGVTGPLGVLPYHYSLLVAERARARDPAMADFFDLFHHRIVSLFYRAWKKNRFAVGVEEGEDPLRQHVLDLVGMGVPAFREGLPFEENVLAYYAGLLSSPQRSAAALEQMLADYFAVPVEVQQFVGGWYGLPPRDQCFLGEPGRVASRLGEGAVVGDEVWDAQSRVRIRLGPLAREQYRRFLPTGDAHETLREMVRFFANDEYEFEVQLVLARDEVPGCVLDQDHVDPQPLGWSTWLRTVAPTRDADETILRL